VIIIIKAIAPKIDRGMAKFGAAKILYMNTLCINKVRKSMYQIM
jgi:hypothetical protein